MQPATPSIGKTNRASLLATYCSKVGEDIKGVNNGHFGMYNYYRKYSAFFCNFRGNKVRISFYKNRSVFKAFEISGGCLGDEKEILNFDKIGSILVGLL